MASGRQGARKDVEADKNITSLIETMNDTFDIVTALDPTSEEVPSLRNALTVFARQAAECASFANKYTRPGFLGRYCLHY